MKKLTNAFEEESNVGTVERIASGAAGVSLMVAGIKGIKNPSVKTVSSLLAGTYLLYRGVTAFCPLRAALEKHPSKG